MHAVQEKAEYNRLVTLVLKVLVFLGQWANKRVCEVRRRQLKQASDMQSAPRAKGMTDRLVS